MKYLKYVYEYRIDGSEEVYCRYVGEYISSHPIETRTGVVPCVICRDDSGLIVSVVSNYNMSSSWHIEVRVFEEKQEEFSKI